MVGSINISGMHLHNMLCQSILTFEFEELTLKTFMTAMLF